MDILPESLTPDACQQLFDLCQRRCRTEGRIGDPEDSLAITVSNGRLRLTNASETTRKLWEPTLRAIAHGWPLAQCVPPQLRRCLKESAASQEDEGRLLSMIQALTDKDLTWQKRVWLTSLCYASGKACVANKAREVLTEGGPGGFVEMAAAK